jgi:4-aminobutyrate aminotransferase/(S)-3-amino-2-methylpropionate transaminase
MGGGLPISAVVGRAEVVDGAVPGTLGGTYGGNPVACASALAAIARMGALDLNARARAIGQRLRATFEELHDEVSVVADVRGLGAMVAIELCHDGDPARPAGDIVKDVVAGCVERGLIIVPAGVHGNVLRTLCPLTIDDETLERGLGILADEIRRCRGQASPARAMSSAT